MVFFRKSSLEQLPVTMSGVRMGERALQFGIGDPSLVGAIASKVGLSGHAAFAANDERHAAKLHAAAAAAGVLIEVQIAPLDTLPFPDDAFDAVIVHAGVAAGPVGGDAADVAILRESRRVLRVGGRMVILEGRGRQGVAAWLHAWQKPLGPGTAVDALRAAGFRTARLIAEREGYRFTEGVK